MAKRTDTNQPEIVRGLRQLGAQVWDTHILEPAGRPWYNMGAGQGRDTGVLFCKSLRVHLQPHTVVNRTPVPSGQPRAVLAGSAGDRWNGGFVMFKRCSYCGLEFRVKPSHYERTVYCSKACQSQDGYVYKSCPGCGCSFFTKACYLHTTRYCSLVCFRATRAALVPHSICRHCGKEFPLNPSHVGKVKYCSPKCRKSHVAETSPVNQFTCAHCGKAFKTYEPQQTFCSLACKAAACQRQKQCPVCGKWISIRRSHYDKKVYCSRACMTLDYSRRFADMGYSRIDANQPEIVEALEKIGAYVWSAADLKGGFPDLIVSFRGTIFLLEVKRPPKGRLTPAQVLWHATYPGAASIVYSLDDALRAIGALEQARPVVVKVKGEA